MNNTNPENEDLRNVISSKLFNRFLVDYDYIELIAYLILNDNKDKGEQIPYYSENILDGAFNKKNYFSINYNDYIEYLEKRNSLSQKDFYHYCEKKREANGIFYEKYLKYKTKYLNLKNQIQ